MASFPLESDGSHKNNRGSQWPWVIFASAVLLAVIALLSRHRMRPSSRQAHPPPAANTGHRFETVAEQQILPRRFGARKPPEPGKSAERIVAEKVRQFARNRRALAERIAHRSNKELPPEIDAFFKALEKGDWDEIHSRWQELATHAHQYDYSKGDRPDLDPYWAMVLDAYGVAEQAHNCPAQELLDYGHAILDSLRPGMVYVGGTDDGRWIPELLNETGDDPHIIVTQNALADGSYLDFVRELYGNQFNALSAEDSQRAFEAYTTDAQKRLQHDLDFPDEPKQVLPGENLKMVDGKLQISGVTAVMAINEKLLQTLMQNNPDLSFALQESQPLRGTYADALPLGPLMELNAQSDQTPFTPELATQSVDYWRYTAQTLLADPTAADSTYTLKAYSHDVNATANLLAAHDFPLEAEEAYTLASEIYPGNPQAVNGLAQVLIQTGHTDEARALLDQFASKYPDQVSGIAQARAAIVSTAPSPKP